MDRILLVAIGYICGLFQTGYLYGELVKHTDIRQSGSGNAGATNSLRVLGVKAGIIVLLGDAMKAMIPCLIVRHIYAGSPEIKMAMMMYMGLGVVLGHSFPCYLKFKGGKGVASTAGIILASDWRITLVCLVVFLLTVILTRYVSLASILVMITTIVMFTWFNYGGFWGLQGSGHIEYLILTLVITGLSIWRHRSNIQRLLAHQENKLTLSKH